MLIVHQDLRLHNRIITTPETPSKILKTHGSQFHPVPSFPFYQFLKLSLAAFQVRFLLQHEMAYQLIGEALTPYQPSRISIRAVLETQKTEILSQNLPMLSSMPLVLQLLASSKLQISQPKYTRVKWIFFFLEYFKIVYFTMQSYFEGTSSRVFEILFTNSLTKTFNLSLSMQILVWKITSYYRLNFLSLLGELQRGLKQSQYQLALKDLL